MVDYYDLKCFNCGILLPTEENQDEISLICPHCGIKNYLSPPFSFFKDELAKSLVDTSRSIERSLQLGEYEQAVKNALKSGDIKKAIEAEGRYIVILFSLNPSIKSELERKYYFEIEMHGFKLEYLDEQGRSLHNNLEKVLKGKDLEKIISAMLELKNYRLKGCNADKELIRRTRKIIIDSARYYVNCFEDATEKEKDFILDYYGLNKGLIRAGDSFFCTACGGEIDIKEEDEVLCPHCKTIFSESYIDLTIGVSLGPGIKELPNDIKKKIIKEFRESGSSISDIFKKLDLPEEFQKEYEGLEDTLNIRSFYYLTCPNCGETIESNCKDKFICPNCGKKII